MNEWMKANLKEWGGVYISDEYADEWIERGIRHLERNPNSNHTFYFSGRRIVFMTRDEGAGEHTYEVFDCTVNRTDHVYVNEDGEIVNKYPENPLED